ncbi:MAG: PAS domain S-box protein [Gemmatimonadales bacterium]
MNPAQAESILEQLAHVFTREPRETPSSSSPLFPNPEAKYRALVEQLPAVVFMAYLDRKIGEAYVSPRIEEAMGFSQTEWLEDPVRWYHHIHPDDQARWSVEAAEMLLTGNPLRSAYRVIARDGRVIWFQCEARVVRSDDGQPWFIHGVGFDITDLKRAEAALQSEGSLLSGILDTVGALVAVLSPSGEIIRFNRACEQLSGHAFEEVRGRRFWELFPAPEESERCRTHLARLRPGQGGEGYEGDWIAVDGTRRRIAWSTTSLPGKGGQAAHIITTGIDITERKRMERALLEISAREQRKIGQDLHDGLGQHLTGIAFMSKVLAQQLAGEGTAQAEQARKIVRLVNEAIDKTRQLARGLLPVFSEADGLMSALKQWADEVEDLFHISCRFECPEPILIRDIGLATHLYHIAQEAVNNALKHGSPSSIQLSLGRENGAGILTVEDDGVGLSEPRLPHPGLGLRIMSYRASMVGGTLEVRRGATCGTVVCCRFPVQD